MVKYHDCPEKKVEEDEYKCDTCGKTYWSEKMLNIHQKTHIKYDDEDDDILNMEIKMPTKLNKITIADDDDEDLVSYKKNHTPPCITGQLCFGWSVQLCCF